jgi:AcrR family transcriptional regulator
MSRRRPAVLRNAAPGRTLREHLISTAARLLAERGRAGLTVREIAHEAQVADGALYNYFEGKDDLLAQALTAHVDTVMRDGTALPAPGQATVAANLRTYIDYGLRVLTGVLPAFAGFLAQPEVIARTGRLLGQPGHAPSLPELVGAYLEGEQRLGRIAPEASVTAATTLIVGACHELTLPRMLFNPQAELGSVPPEAVDDLVAAVMTGIAPS